MISPDRKFQTIQHVIQKLGVSERKACRALGQLRSTQRHDKRNPDDEEVLTTRIIELASQYGRYGCRSVTALLRNEGWRVNHKHVEPIGRREELKIPQEQPERGCLCPADGSVVRLKPLFPKHVWSYNFMQDRTYNGVPFRILSMMDEYTRGCLAVRVDRMITSPQVLSVLMDLFIQRGIPVHIPSDNGSEFMAKKVRSWLAGLEIKPLFIEPGSP